MTTSFRLTENHLGELEAIETYGNIAYVVNSPAWHRIKEMELRNLVTFVSRQSLVGYEETDCFEITDKGRRILHGL